MLKKILKPTYLSRFLFFFLSDALIIIASLYLAFFLRFAFHIPAQYREVIYSVLTFFLAVKLVFFGAFRLYQITWRFVGLRDLVNICFAIGFSGVVLFLFFQIFMGSPVPKSIFLIDFNITFLLASLLRISKRVYLEIIKKNGRRSRPALRTLIIGAGNTGEMILRDMARQKHIKYYTVCFIDDDSAKVGAYVHGIKVIGRTDQLEHVLKSKDIEAMIIAIPSLNHQQLRVFYETAKKLDIKDIKIVPRIYDYDRPEINLKQLEDISIEDLIGRQSVVVDYKGIREFLHGKRILISGAGGSIGSEITRQVCSFDPGMVLLFDIDETGLHNMELKLKREFPHFWGTSKDKVVFITGDVRDSERIEETFARFKPEIVFHAAAYKHVPMMECNPKEAAKVNIFGSYHLAQASVKHSVQQFVMLSTDKAVLPTSVMGGTKRFAEKICRAFNSSEKTEFISVRFGNVLGSRGSVLPLFLEQLKQGGPLTVTHKEIRRYFMTIPEAVTLVLQASLLGNGGDILVLDMGEPIKIINIAEELIRIHGLEPYEDIDICEVGLRPGEKMFEDILSAEEGTSATQHEKVFIAKGVQKYNSSEIASILDDFRQAISISGEAGDEAVKILLKKHVSYYQEKENNVFIQTRKTSSR